MMMRPALDIGTPLSYERVTSGLKALSPGLHFDMGAALGMWHPYIETRAGVFYEGRHICSIDRGMIPEFKIWSVRKAPVEIPMSEIEHWDGSFVNWVNIQPSETARYHDAFGKAKAKDDRYKLLPSGHVREYHAYKIGTVLDRVVRVGWRHTFERILGVCVPGINRARLSKTFRVDMFSIPIGPADEIERALIEE